MEQKNIKDIPTPQLKIIAYDLMNDMQVMQNQISMINTEIMQRVQAEANLKLQPETETPERPRMPGEVDKFHKPSEGESNVKTKE